MNEKSKIQAIYILMAEDLAPRRSMTAAKRILASCQTLDLDEHETKILFCRFGYADDMGSWAWFEPEIGEAFKKHFAKYPSQGEVAS